MSRLEPPKAQKKSSHPQRRRSDSWGRSNTISSRLTSHTRVPSRVQPTAPTSQTDDVDLLTAPTAGSDFPPSLQEITNGGGSQGGGEPAASEGGGGGGILGVFGGASGGPSSGGSSSAMHASEVHVSGVPPRIGKLVAPEIPPPLKDLNRRANLVDDKPPEEMADELMIGEIKVLQT